MTEITTPGAVDLAPGAYDYAASLPGYRTITGTVTVVDGETTDLVLEFVPETGSVNVTSTPSGATIVFTLIEE